MNLFKVLEISGSALLAERQRAEVVTSNLANAETTHGANGGPYQRMHVVFGAEQVPSSGSFPATMASFTDLHAEGVRVERVVPDGAPPVRRFEPGHPDADADGYVTLSNVNVMEEMSDMMGATRAYEANVNMAGNVKQMFMKSLEIGQ